MGWFSNPFQQLIDTIGDLARDRLVRERELEPELEELRQLRHLVQPDVGVRFRRLPLLGFHELREEVLREHDDLAVQVGAVVEIAGVGKLVTVLHPDRVHYVMPAKDRGPVQGVVDAGHRPELLDVHRDAGQRLQLGEPARLATGEQLRRHLAQRVERDVDGVRFG
jgi:hypothetical protein